MSRRTYRPAPPPPPEAGPGMTFLAALAILAIIVGSIIAGAQKGACYQQAQHTQNWAACD